jgi:hypothetical protein
VVGWLRLPRRFSQTQLTAMEWCSAVTMPRKQKLDRERVMASLNTLCPKCGMSITPDRVRRIDFDHVECPACREQFIPTKLTAQ